MDRIVIQGIGLISKLGNCEDEVLYNFESKECFQKEQLDFENILEHKKVRRMNRIAKMLTCTIKNCIKNAEQELSLNLYDTGVIVNVGYGPMNTIKDFATIISMDMPELASPMDFANTVFNAVVGHAAMYFGFKGPSTVLMGGNSVLYTMRLLKKKAADHILVCGVEEYFKPAYEYARMNYKESLFCEGAASLLLSNKGESEYGYIIGSAESGLGYSPLYSQCVDESANISRMIKKAINTAQINPNEIDCVFFASDKCTGLRESEEKAVDEIFEKTVEKVYIKDLLGETLGAGMTLSVAVAAIAMKAGKYKKVLVSGIEVSGTLETFVLSCNLGGTYV